MSDRKLSFWSATAHGLLLGVMASFGASSVFAQGFSPPTPEESFRRMDQNGNGQIDPEELQRLPSFIRDAYTRAGIDGSRAISQREFIDSAQRVREQFGRTDFRRPEGGGGFGGGFGSPPGSDSGRDSRRDDERRDGSRSDERREDRRDDSRRREDDSGDRRGSSSSTSKSGKKAVKPKPRITKDLPDEYRARDKNSDGQVGLYEWDRKLFAQFYELDRNGDGFLTADELIKPTSKPGTKGSTSRTVVTKTSSGSSETKPELSKGSDPGKLSAPSTAPSSSDKSQTVSSDSPGARAFDSLDINKDGQLTQEEFERSRSARRKFDGITIKFPIKQAQFVELYGKPEGS